MKCFVLIGYLSLLAFTHPFARDGSVEVNDSELWRERIERARENDATLEWIQEEESKQRQEESFSDEFDVTRSDKEKAQDLVR